MANVLQIKRSSTASNVPAVGELVQGELAINIADERLFSKNSSNAIFEITDHDNLTNYVANEHIDWTSATQNFSTSGTLFVNGDATFGLSISLGDNHPIYMGDADDCSLQFNGTHLYLDTPAAADQYFRTTNGTKTGLLIEDEGAVSLYFNNAVKLATQSGGVNVTGTMTATTVSGGNVTSGTDPGHTHTAYLTSVAFNDLTAKTSGTGNYSTTGDMFADNFGATGLGPLTAPPAEDAYLGGYGVVGNRSGAAVYLTNANATGLVAINAGGVHGTANNVARFTTASVELDQNLFIEEGTAAAADIANYGQFWVKTATPNIPYFTDDAGNDFPLGFNTMPPVTISASQNMLLTQVGRMLHKNAGGAITLTCNSDSTVPDGSTWAMHNDDTEDVTIAGSGTTVYWLEAGSAPAAGSVTVVQGGIVTIYKYSSTQFWVWGAKAAAGGGGVTFPLDADDNEKIRFGTGQDAEIYFDATNFQILTTAGDIYLTSGGGDIFLEDNTYVRNGGVLRVQDGTNNDYCQMNHDGADFNFAFGGTANIDFSGASIMRLQSDMVLAIDERATAPTGAAAYGTFWIKNDTPNTPWFTNDSSEDFPLGYAAYNLLGNQSLAMTTASVAEQCVNGLWYKTTTTARTLTLETSSTVNFPVGAQMTIVNAGSSGNLSVVDQTTNTCYVLTGSAKTDIVGTATIAPGGYATLIRVSSTETWLMGAGVTP